MTNPSGRGRRASAATGISDDLPPAVRLVRRTWEKLRPAGDIGHPPDEKALAGLVERCWGLGEQGKAAVEDFSRGCAALGTYTWRGRVAQLTQDALDLEDGRTIFGTARQTMSDPEYSKWRQLIEEGKAKARQRERGDVLPTVGQVLARKEKAR